MIAFRSVLVRTLCAALLAAPAATALAQEANTIGPLPPALAAAKTIFISNAGADAGLFPTPFSGDPARSYSTLYEHLNGRKVFRLVNSPAEADLVLEIALTAPVTLHEGSKSNGAGEPNPMFRLTVYDRPTHYILWTETETVDPALMQKTHDRNFDTAIDALIDRLLTVTLHSPAAH